MKLTTQQINQLNNHQRDGRFHPLTCGGSRTDAKHLDGEGILEATEDGWKCPYCDYLQPFSGRLENIVLSLHSRD